MSCNALLTSDALADKKHGSAHVAFEFIRQCVGTHRWDHCARVDLARSRDFQWKDVLRQAHHHLVQPLVYRATQAAGITCPANLRTRFAEDMRAIKAWNKFGLTELQRILTLFEEKGVPALVFKGPVLSHLSYGSTDLRFSADLDVLVRPSDMDEVDALLTEDEYRRLNSDSTSLHRKIRFYFQKEHHYSRGNLIYNFDVHTTAIKPSLGQWTTFEVLSERAQDVHIAGNVFPSLSTEDLLQLLCFHGAKDRWTRLRRICDISGLIHRNPNIDWTAVIERAQATRCERILCLGLYITDTVLGLSLPNHMFDFVCRYPQMMYWGDRLAARLPSRSYNSTWGSLRERVAYPLAIQDTLAGKVRYATYAGLGKLVSRIT